MSSEIGVVLTKTILGIPVERSKRIEGSTVVGKGLVIGALGLQDIKVDVRVEPGSEEHVTAALKIRGRDVGPFHVISEDAAHFNKSGRADIYLASWLFTYKVTVVR